MPTYGVSPGSRLFRVASPALVLFLLASSMTAQLVISEFRVRGPSGANDEFVEIYNNSGADHTVAASSGTGYAIAASDGIVRCSIPNGTVIPSRGHYLCVNSGAYSLGGYATGDATFATDIPDNAGIALFNNDTGGGNFNLANRFDAVGSTSEADTLYKEGTGYPALTAFSIDYSFYRDNCGKAGSITTLGPCPTGGDVVDTNNNAVDFIFVDTNGTSAGAGQRLGAPGPENLASPITATPAGSIAALDATVGDFVPPNLVRDFTSDPGNNSTFGTLSIRRRYVNNSGAPLTRLRFRIIDQTTFPAPSGFADLRSRTSVAVVVAGINDTATCAATGAPPTPPCTVTVQGTTLEQPPSSPNGNAFNSSMSAGTVTPGTPLANGASLNLQFLLGIQQTGVFKVGLLVEALPGGSGELFEISGCTDGCPVVTSIVRADPDPTTSQVLHYTVTFSESVTGVDATDFALTPTGSVAGATITGVSGSGAVYTVTVDRGTGTGTLRLDLIDNDSIVNGAAVPLGGAGAGNGTFTTGEFYTILAGAAPTVSSIVRADPDPTTSQVLHFTVTFSESVTGVDATDFALTTTGTIAGATVTGVSGSGAVYTVTVDRGTGTGTIRLDLIDNDSIVNGALVPLGGVGAGNGNFTTGQFYTIVAGAVAAAVPMLDARGLAVLAGLLLALGILILRRT